MSKTFKPSVRPPVEPVELARWQRENFRLTLLFLDGLNARKPDEVRKHYSLYEEGKVERDELNMRIWGLEGSCGTAACLGGWMTTSPELRERGLYKFVDVVSKPESAATMALMPVVFEAEGEEEESVHRIGAAALALFLGLNEWRATAQFSGYRKEDLETLTGQLRRTYERGPQAYEAEPLPDDLPL